MATIGKKIKLARNGAGMTQEELGKKAGISRQNICNYEKDLVKNIPGDRIHRIATALDISEAWLMGYDYDPETEDRNFTKIKHIYLDILNGDGQEMLCTYATDLSELPKYQRNDDEV